MNVIVGLLIPQGRSIVSHKQKLIAQIVCLSVYVGFLLVEYVYVSMSTVAYLLLHFEMNSKDLRHGMNWAITEIPSISNALHKLSMLL